MKKTLSILLSIMMLFSITAGMDFSSYAQGEDPVNVEKTLSTNGTWVTGSINEKELKFYKFTIPSDGTIDLGFISYYYHGDCYVLNPDFSNVTSITWANGSENSPSIRNQEVSLSKGTYYLKIENYYGDSGEKFQLSVKFSAYGNNEAEPNDSGNPMELRANQTITGALTEQDEFDWYKITISERCSIKTNFSFYMRNIKYDFYSTCLDEFGEIVLNEKLDSINPSGGKPEAPISLQGTYDLSKGIYYIKITRDDNYNESFGKYKLIWNYDITVNKPSSFKVSTRNTTSLKLSWKKASGVNGYQLQQYKGGKWTTVSTTTANSFTVKKLKAGTSYKFRVRSYKNFSGSKYYSGWVALTTPTKPSTVTLSSVKAGKKAFTVKWKKTTCTGYQIQYSTNKNFKNGNKTVTISKNSTTSKTVSKLKAKKKYYVRVRAYKTVNGTKYYGSWSKTKTITTKK